MTRALPVTLTDAFALAAAELGMYSAARLFVREIEAIGGAALRAELRDELGPRFPVLEVVASRAIAGRPPSIPDPRPVVEACVGLSRLVVIGVEVDCLDALLPLLPESLSVALLLDRTLEPDQARVMANYDGRAEACELGEVTRFAGARAGLLTFVYGTDGFRAAVPPSWLRAVSSDIRPVFRSILGWNVLGPPMESYPRWLIETSAGDFSQIIGTPA